MMGGAEHKRFAAVGVDGWHFRLGGRRQQEHRKRAGGNDEASSRWVVHGCLTPSTIEGVCT
jgi:hypothetical protein